MSQWAGWKTTEGDAFVESYNSTRTSRKQDCPHLSVPVANLQSGACNESMGASKVAPLVTPCCLHVRSFRHRLADSDGICAKYLIDGLIHAGILSDDSPKEVIETRFSQCHIPTTQAEYTELEIIPVDIC